MAIPVATAAVLAVQVQLARRGRRLEAGPLLLDGFVGPDRSAEHAVTGSARSAEPAVTGSARSAEPAVTGSARSAEPAVTGPDRSAEPAAGGALHIVWLGDSTAAGVGATSADRTVPRRVAKLLARPVEVTSLAASGARIADVLAEQVPQLQRPDLATPDVIAISVGANDVTHITPLHRFVRTYDAVLDQLPTSARVVLLGVPDMGSMPRIAQPLRAITGLRGRRMAAAVHRIATRRRFGFVDIAEATGRVFRDAPGASFAGDQYHPSDEGYRVWAEAVAPVMQEEIAHARP